MGFFSAPSRLYVTIRPAIPAERGVIESLHSAAVDAAIEPWWPPSIRGLLHDGRYQVLVAERGRVLAGYALYAPAGPDCELKLIAVHPGWRRKGIATRLAQWLIGRAGSFGVSVPEECLVGQQFARSLGLAVNRKGDRHAAWDDFWTGWVYRFRKAEPSDMEARKFAFGAEATP